MSVWEVIRFNMMFDRLDVLLVSYPIEITNYINQLSENTLSFTDFEKHILHLEQQQFEQ